MYSRSIVSGKLLVMGLLFFLSLPLLCPAQCELTVKDSFRVNWKDEYRQQFNGDAAAGDAIICDEPEIEADSVLACYWVSDDPQTNYTMVCCFVLAEEYARNELQQNIDALCKKLKEDDAVAFCTAQDAWQKYYDLETRFVLDAFYAYANMGAYNLGRDVMIERYQHLYKLIKERIISVKYYNLLATTEE